MNTPAARDVRVFVPTKDLDESIRFYEALGWQCNWREEGLAEIELSSVRLYLQRFYAKEWAENFMIYIVVDDAEAWYKHAAEVVESGAFPVVRANPPKQEPYGALVTYVWDPCGILLHFAQPRKTAT